MPDVVTMDGVDSDAELCAQVVRLQRRVRQYNSVMPNAVINSSTLDRCTSGRINNCLMV